MRHEIDLGQMNYKRLVFAIVTMVYQHLDFAERYNHFFLSSKKAAQMVEWIESLLLEQ